VMSVIRAERGLRTSDLTVSELGRPTRT